jgi:hypothetical protein
LLGLGLRPDCVRFPIPESGLWIWDGKGVVSWLFLAHRGQARDLLKEKDNKAMTLKTPMATPTKE